MKPQTPPRLVLIDDPLSATSEAYRVLRTNLHYANPNAPLRRILVTSTAPTEGKSTTVSNLGVALAQTERSVLLVDADLRRPILHLIFNQRPSPGLTSYLAGEGSFQAAIVKTSVPNLSLVPSGRIPPNPAELLASRRMREFLDAAVEKYDVVLLDSPPILPVTDACALAAMMDGVVLVVGSGTTPEGAVRRAKEQVEAAHGKIVGVVVNRLETKSDGYSRYYRYYGKEKRPVK